MDWQVTTVLGACGGAVVSLVTFCSNIFTWYEDRHTAHARRAKKLPKLTSYVDLYPDLAVLVTRVVLGVAAGAIFHAQVSGAEAAIAVGASAPALLAQLRTGRFSSTVGAPEGTSSAQPASNKLSDLNSVVSEEGGTLGDIL